MTSAFVYYYSGFHPWQKWLASIFLLPLCLYFVFTWGEYTLLDSADLIIHEAGHGFLIFFGNFIYAAGGTIMQILFPLLLIYYFWRQKYRAGMQVFIFWLGQNFINISVYAADAQAKKLPLLGNNRHDWYYMLGESGIREYCEWVGALFFTAGILAFLVSVTLPIFSDQ